MGYGYILKDRPILQQYGIWDASGMCCMGYRRKTKILEDPVEDGYHHLPFSECRIVKMDTNRERS